MSLTNRQHDDDEPGVSDDEEEEDNGVVEVMGIPSFLLFSCLTGVSLPKEVKI